LDREAFNRYVNDQSRLARLRADKSFVLQSGYAEEVSERKPKMKDWTPPALRRSEHVQQERF
jgi:hypothetical protein